MQRFAFIVPVSQVARKKSNGLNRLLCHTTSVGGTKEDGVGPLVCANQLMASDTSVRCRSKQRSILSPKRHSIAMRPPSYYRTKVLRTMRHHIR
eukprot:scaffold162318_cov21-Prasinocladus_malaysianus.AAC.1